MGSRLVDQAKCRLEEAYLTVAAARREGVTIAMGFDSGPPGYELRELVRLADAGSHSRSARGGHAAVPRPSVCPSWDASRRVR